MIHFQYTINIITRYNTFGGFCAEFLGIGVLGGVVVVLAVGPLAVGVFEGGAFEAGVLETGVFEVGVLGSGLMEGVRACSWGGGSSTTGGTEAS